MVKQGDIIKINLNPKEGYEQQGYRPYICLSYKGVTKYSNIAIFAPISNTKREYPFYVPIEKTCQTTGKVLLDQLVAIDFNARKFVFVETVSNNFINDLLRKVKVIFQKD
ncbi:growth inhibitor PemK [Enterococcus villorum]|jgi:mRNA interferase MazF|uniref:Growth inhibitor PemK n=1 Tax=Enterococcus villorum TaxID=112904 RepID=A0A1V8YM68_9ENTE|nr:type II toxin-antitoxin system PemK/MazF family toxin [Enterococcus villorum]OQO69525.1 growth inhibitor PemK [Enterococcus villorum]OQO73704.1 growth inhibitor PemK [Enterococcus villorum]